MNPSEHDAILEIGFGNGKYIGEIAKITREGLVAGIDYSATMVSQALSI